MNTSLNMTFNSHGLSTANFPHHRSLKNVPVLTQTKTEDLYNTKPQKPKAKLIKNRGLPPADKTVQTTLSSHFFGYSEGCMMGRVQFSFQQTTDILMKGVLSPTLRLLAPFAPGCEPSERASCLRGPATQQNRRPGGVEQEAFLSLRCDPPPSHSCRNDSGSISACSPPLVKLDSQITLAMASIHLHATLCLSAAAGAQVHVRQCQQVRQLAISEQQQTSIH